MTADRNEAMSQHDRDSRELRELCAQRDAARATVRQQAERIAELEGELTKRHKRLHDTEELAGHYLVQRDDATAERDQLRAEVERLRGERMVFVELVRDLIHVVDTIQPHSDETTEIEMLHELTTRARSAIDGVLRAIEAAKEA